MVACSPIGATAAFPPIMREKASLSVLIGSRRVRFWRQSVHAESVLVATFWNSILLVQAESDAAFCLLLFVTSSRKRAVAALLTQS